MKVLILSCNMGEGHNAAGRAIYEKFIQLGVECVFADTLEIAGLKVSRAVNNTYVGITRHSPKLFGAIYSIGRSVSDINTNKLGIKSPVYSANALYRKKLAAYINNGGFDVAVLPHLFPAECLTYLKKHSMADIPFINIATDYTCIPFWEETSPNYFVIPHEDLETDFCSKKIPRRVLLPYGIPVRDCFKEKLPKSEARQQLGLKQDVPVMLLMSGSMGFGRPEALALAINKQFNGNAQIIIMCGRNEKMKQHLIDVSKKYSSIIPLSFTDQVSLYMDAADIVFTKPGGLTSTEAAVKNVPLIHTAPIPGCETINNIFFANHGMSIGYGLKTPEEFATAAFELYNDKDEQNRMLIAQRVNINQNSAHDICSFIMDRYGDKDNKEVSK